MPRFPTSVQLLCFLSRDENSYDALCMFSGSVGATQVLHVVFYPCCSCFKTCT